ncbi:MAG: VOC family protein [Candidatus Heimdallarchaeota archaeon]|nr:VOC family protein [Candidatus Heimdallarchaeota archaeon]MCK4972509.1 VOC family protein [Candidatus Heimdallarchaeota archaeon]
MSDNHKTPIKYKAIYFAVMVKDLERAKKFYEDTFGFKVAWYEGPEIGWCEFHLPTTNSRLGLNASGKDKEFGENNGVLSLEVENLEETKEYLDSKGIKTSEIFDNPNFVSFFNLEDSEGNRIQIVADPRIRT